MNFTDFFKIPINARLAMLLNIAPITERERKRWLTLLPLMNEEEKMELQKLFEEDLEELGQLETESLQMLDSNIQDVLASAKSNR